MSRKLGEVQAFIQQTDERKRDVEERKREAEEMGRETEEKGREAEEVCARLKAQIAELIKETEGRG